MKVYHFDFFLNIITTTKKKILPILSLFYLFNIHAQERNNVRFKIEPGFLLIKDSENLGLLLNIEPNIKISENSVIGLRFGMALNAQKFENNNSSQFNFNVENDNAIISFLPTFDYYLNENYSCPYLGLGIGYYITSTIDIANPTENVTEGNVNNQLGVLLRSGLEVGRTRLGLEYNFIPKADIKIPNGQTIGTVQNSYLGASIGFMVGGKKKSI